jgi:hypothetical protein
MIKVSTRVPTREGARADDARAHAGRAAAASDAVAARRTDRREIRWRFMVRQKSSKAARGARRFGGVPE